MIGNLKKMTVVPTVSLPSLSYRKPIVPMASPKHTALIDVKATRDLDFVQHIEKKVQEQKRELEERNSYVQGIVTKVDSLVGALKQERGKTSLYEKQRGMLSNEITRLNSEFSDLHMKFINVQRVLGNEQKSNNEMKKLLTDLKGQVEVGKNRQAELLHNHNSVKTLENRNVTFKTQNCTFDNTVKVGSSRSNKSGNSGPFIYADNIKIISGLEQERGKLANVIRELETELNSQKRITHSLQEQIMENDKDFNLNIAELRLGANAKSKEMSSIIRMLKNSKTYLETTNKKLNEEKEKLVNTLKEFEHNAKVLAESLEEVEERYKGEITDANQLILEMDENLRSSLKTIRENGYTVQSIDKENEILKGELQVSRSDNELYIQANNISKTQISELKDTNECLENRIQCYLKENEEMKTRLEEFDSLYNIYIDTDRSHQDLIQTHSALNNEMVELREKHSKDIEEWKEIHENQQQQVKEMKKVIEKYKIMQFYTSAEQEIEKEKSFSLNEIKEYQAKITELETTLKVYKELQIKQEENIKYCKSTLEEKEKLLFYLKKNQEDNRLSSSATQNIKVIVEDIERAFICTICLKNTEPSIAMLSCGHLSCKNCISTTEAECRECGATVLIFAKSTIFNRITPQLTAIKQYIVSL